jgi:hypothetical protein
MYNCESLEELEIRATTIDQAYVGPLILYLVHYPDTITVSTGLGGLPLAQVCL